MHYYVNNITGVSTWEAPYIVQVYLGTDEEDTSFGQYQSARLGNRHISPVEAAAMIQTAFRRYLAVLHVFEYAKKVSETVLPWIPYLFQVTRRRSRCTKKFGTKINENSIILT